MLRKAIDFSPGSTPLYFAMADSYRATNECEKALPYYERGLRGRSYDYPRAGMIACLVWLGQYDRAREAALVGLREGEDGRLFRTWLRLADSGRKINAPPHTIRYTADSMSTASRPLP